MGSSESFLERFSAGCSVLASLPASERKVLTGVSGGADSVALMVAFRELGIEQHAVHCNFHLRGEESDRDERFVRELCQRLSIPLEVKDFDVEHHIAQCGGSVEMACRDLRYDYFFRLMDRLGCSRVAVAHNANDNIETFFLNLMRGAGLRGLKGMSADSGKILRPMLRLSREEIEGFLRERNFSFIVDSTNLSSDYRRNFIRNEVMPLLRTRWPQCEKSIQRSMDNISSDFDLLHGFIDSQADLRKLSYVELGNSGDSRSLLFHFIASHGGSRSIAEQIWQSLPNPRRGATWQLGEAECRAEKDCFVILKHLAPEIPELEVTPISTDDFDLAEIKKNDGNRTLYIADSPADYELRLKRDGDRIALLGMKGSSLVNDIVRDARISEEKREGIAVFVHKGSGEIIWIPGLKRSRHRLIDLKNPPTTIYRIREKDSL